MPHVQAPSFGKKRLPPAISMSGWTAAPLRQSHRRLAHLFAVDLHAEFKMSETELALRAELQLRLRRHPMDLTIAVRRVHPHAAFQMSMPGPVVLVKLH